MNLNTVACWAEGVHFSCRWPRGLPDGAMAVISALVSEVFSPKTSWDLLLATRNAPPRRRSVAALTLRCSET